MGPSVPPGLADFMACYLAHRIDDASWARWRRGAHATYDLVGTYPIATQDGGVIEVTGAEIIATGFAVDALLSAIRRREDPAVVLAAYDRLNRTIDPWVLRERARRDEEPPP